MNHFSQNLDCIKAQNEIQLGNISQASQKHISKCEECLALKQQLCSEQTLNELFNEQETAPSWDSFAQKMGFEDSAKTEENEQNSFQFLNGLLPRFAICCAVIVLIVSGGLVQVKLGSDKLLKGQNQFLKTTATNYQRFVKSSSEKIFRQFK
jgi:hypothetical protein